MRGAVQIKQPRLQRHHESSVFPQFGGNFSKSAALIKLFMKPNPLISDFLFFFNEFSFKHQGISCNKSQVFTTKRNRGALISTSNIITKTAF